MTLVWLVSNWRWLIGALATGILAAFLATTTIDRNQWRATARKADATLASVQTAEKQATIAAQADHDSQEQRYKDLANARQADKSQQDAVVHDAIGDYADTHRVPVCPAQNRASQAATSAAHSDSGVSPIMPTGSVFLSQDDLQKCGDAVTYALESHAWVLQLNP